MSNFSTLTEMAAIARKKLNKGDWDYLIGAADTETSLRRNRAGLDSWAFLPRILTDVSNVEYGTELLDQRLRIPVILPPIGSIQAFTNSGAIDVARAAAEFGTLQILSSSCSPDFETVAMEVQGPRIYQLYLTGDESWMDSQIERAIKSGYRGFCLTADTQVYSRRERDIIKGYLPQQAREAMEANGGQTMADQGAFNYQSTMTWETVRHIKGKFDIPLVVKGVMSPTDAKHCVEAGVDVIYVSNHGGRQLDHSIACIDALPDVVNAVDGRCPVLVDGGFMRGADVVKALCLGASAVGVGRLEALAVSAGGWEGLVRALQILEREIGITMALLGAANLRDLNPDLLRRQEGPPAHQYLSAFPFLDEEYFK